MRKLAGSEIGLCGRRRQRIHGECIGRVEIDGGDRLPACSQRSAKIGVQSDSELLIGRQGKICRNDYGTCRSAHGDQRASGAAGNAGIGLRAECYARRGKRDGQLGVGCRRNGNVRGKQSGIAGDAVEFGDVRGGIQRHAEVTAG